ncbi:MAG: heparinase II/III domain-containing protein [Oceanipulchritudo sp.]
MSANANRAEPFRAENPVSREWVQANLRPEHPRLILTPQVLEAIRAKRGTEGPEALAYRMIRRQADALLEEPPLTRQLTGRRLLYVSREAVGRTTALALAYLVEENPAYLKRLEGELLSLCSFEDWNPSHFLDVAEMAVAVTLPLDWCGDAIGGETRKRMQDALLNKALLPSLGDGPDNWWIEAHHNWNLVCHGGLAVAALAVFESHPDIATRVLQRSVAKAPLGLKPYAPEGAYNEGPSYWFYATDFLTLTLSAYRTALGTDFGVANAPGVRKSALFSLLTGGPSGDLYNYADSGKGGFMEYDHIGLLAWFVPVLGKSLPERVWERLPEAISNEPQPIDRMSVFYLVNLVNMPADLPPLQFPRAWVIDGPAPVGVLRPETEEGMYLAAKGGSADDNHAHMDAGSFILEWRRIRWAVDPGKLDYTAVEAAIGAKGLWNRSQDSPRWELLAHNNFGHSALTVNGEKHLAEGRALVVSQDLDPEQPAFTFDLTSLYGGNLASAFRTFQRLSENSIRITDDIVTTSATRTLTWQLVTLADVEPCATGAFLRQEGEQIELKVCSPDNFEIRVVPLTPASIPYDLELPGLKCIEVQMIPNEEKNSIVVELAGGVCRILAFPALGLWSIF